MAQKRPLASKKKHSRKPIKKKPKVAKGKASEKKKRISQKSPNSSTISNIEIIENGSPFKKRVSFAPKLVDKKRVKNGSDENQDESTPLKPILKRSNEKSIERKKKRLRLQTGESTESSPILKKKKKVGITVNGKNSTTKVQGKSIVKKKKVIVVKKSVKEQLLNMDRKERKAFVKKLRADRKPYFELALKAKKLWEQIRRKSKSKAEDRQKLVDELYALVEGKVVNFIYAHDTVRVIQCLMALKGHPEIRTKLFDEVKGEILLMSKSKYAKFFVIKMLKYGTPAQREYIMQCFYGKIPRLLKHSMASEVVEYAYNEYANALQRSRIISEFYSSEFGLWKVEEALTLDKILEKEPQRKSTILQNMKEHIMDLSTKPVLKHSLVHRLIREYLDYCGPNDRKEIIDSLKERVIEMVHTRDGAIVSMRCIWYGTPKERKLIVKMFKSLVTKTCCDEYGYLVLLAIFDSVDDTLLVEKIILKEIAKSLDEIMTNKHGLKVLHYLLKPRVGQQFLKQTIALLSEGDKNPYSKKEPSERYQELLSAISPALLAHCATNMKGMIMDSHTSLLVLSILENAIGDKTEAYVALCKDVLSEEFVPMNIENLHAVETPHSHFVLKKLIRNDKALHERGERTLSETLVDQLSPEHFLSWMSCNKGAFILLHMYETGVEKVQKIVKSVVTCNAGRKKLKQYTFPAAKLLATKFS